MFYVVTVGQGTASQLGYARTISLSRQTYYSGKKKKDPLGLGCHNMVSEPRFINT